MIVITAIRSGIGSKRIEILSRLPLNRILKKEALGGATGWHHRPRHFTGFWRLEGHPPVRLAVGPSGKAPLTAEMEIRVLGVADRPPAVMLLEGGNSLVLLLLGHDTTFLHAHGARQDCLLRVGSYSSYRNCSQRNVPQNGSTLLLRVHEKWGDLRAR
jgi:hypothetical protein